ncbi:MAG: hypothetical protein ABFC96_17310 [Thermoguttaceae bacterium]
MPCYLFTFHAYGTWMPDRDEGFVRRERGLMPPNRELADAYRRRATEDRVVLEARIQLLLIEEARIAFGKQRYRGHYIATDPTHVHILASWADDRLWNKIRNGLKSSLTRRLNRDVSRRNRWFVDSASRKRVMDNVHFEVNTYLASHRGWKWREGGEPFQ